MEKNKNTGNEGEKIAANFLTSKNYKIIAQNWRAGHLEIDIIALYQNYIVFAEVKTRSSTYFEHPFQAVNAKKQRFIIKAANVYIEKYEIDFEARFDIISVIKTAKGYEIDHIEDAFYPHV